MARPDEMLSRGREPTTRHGAEASAAARREPVVSAGPGGLGEPGGRRRPATLAYARPEPRDGLDVPSPAGLACLAATAAVGGLVGMVLAFLVALGPRASEGERAVAAAVGVACFVACAGGAVTLVCLVVDRIAPP